jgi:hypothetical protein
MYVMFRPLRLLIKRKKKKENIGILNMGKEIIFTIEVG